MSQDEFPFKDRRTPQPQPEWLKRDAATWQHRTGWLIQRKAWNRANHPYLIYDPKGRPYTAPSGYGFSTIKRASQAINDRLKGNTTTSTPLDYDE